MQLTADLLDVPVLITGSAVAARRTVRRYRAAGAQVRTIDCPAHFVTSTLDEVRVVVAVDDGDPGWAPLGAACRLHNVLLVREQAALPGRNVTLIGGGPGPADLLTARAVAALAEADVVFYDRLGPAAELDRLAPGAELVDVGKTPGHHRVPQEEIERLMVASAHRGHRVVRLKGGDPFVFGRGGEEVAACVAAGIPVTVVPGISSAISVPAAAGIPVTHRNVSHSFTVVSGHAPLSTAEHTALAGLAAAGGTIVVLMGIGTLPHLVAGLLRSGLAATTPAAVIERGYSRDQRTTNTELGNMVTATATCSNPAVLVIGAVAALGASSAATAEMNRLAAAMLHP
jgi:uroporphyrin-III C-methyltransferase